ncbi:hypothetical protein D3C71_1055240 [compost metagenome]
MTLKYDPTIQVGDIVTGYHKGYWKVDVVLPRIGTSPLIYYTRIDKEGQKSCDGSYCRKVDPLKLRDQMYDEANKLYDLLMKAQAK